MQTLRQLRLVLHVAAALCCSASSASHYKYTVSGSVRTEYGPGIGHHGRGPFGYEFTVHVCDEKWSIKLTPEKDNVTASGDYLEASSDGQFFYFVVNTASEKAKDPKVENRGVAFRGVGSVPYGACFDEIICLWYAYGSHTYLKSVTGAAIYPLQMMPLSYFKGKGYLQQAEWALTEAPPNLPSSIVIRATRQGTGINGVPPQLFTNAAFSVHAFTNISGIALPRQIEVSYFFCDPPPRTFTAQLRSRVTISADAFSRESDAGPTFVPDLPNPSIVTDLRYLTGSVPIAVSGLATQWPVARQVSSLYQQRVALETARKKTASRQRTLLRYILYGLVAIPVFLLPVWIWKSRASTKTH